MYAAGSEHPHRAASMRAIALVVEGEIAAALDAEVLQEILHRYTAIRRPSERDAIYEDARTIFSHVFPISAAIMDRAFHLLRTVPQLSARDAIHAAVVRAEGLEAICSFDRDYDLVPGLRRVEPGQLLGPSGH